MEIKNNPAFSQATQNTSKGKQIEQASTQGSNHSGTQASSSSRADSVTFTSDALRLHALVRDAIENHSVVDIQRVDSVRLAIKEGSFEINPEQIATKMIAMEQIGTIIR